MDFMDFINFVEYTSEQSNRYDRNNNYVISSRNIKWDADTDKEIGIFLHTEKINRTYNNYCKIFDERQLYNEYVKQKIKKYKNNMMNTLPNDIINIIIDYIN